MNVAFCPSTEPGCINKIVHSKNSYSRIELNSLNYCYSFMDCNACVPGDSVFLTVSVPRGIYDADCILIISQASAGWISNSGFSVIAPMNRWNE